jgi:hypothetical protein
MADVTQIKPQARIKLQKNTGVVLYDQQFAPSPATYTSHVAQAISVATNTTVTLSQGNITAVRNVLLQSDNAVTVKVNGNATGVPLVSTNAVYAAYSTSLTQVDVFNDSATNVANIQYVLSN